ncbi:MAG: cyclic 2,3-diphosphoglycerate synthase [Candidatus Eisenbacteria bacterium]|nr:cyclic 2,3-diphosphoglycerate synthase [Candidatus Eisenbacteria bacterium]
MVVERRKVIIMGAGGRDFHNFNLFFKDKEQYEVVAFTATQIPHIDKRVYPPSLSGGFYPRGIPIHPEEELPSLVKDNGVMEVVFAYSDVSHEYVMHKASLILSLGACFSIIGTSETMLESKVPVISVLAVRTGCGKSAVTRRVAEILREDGHKVVVVRHPMPYGDLTKQGVQRFETFEDLDRHNCTIEEREEYEPHIEKGVVVFAGVAYGEILNAASKEADFLLWDGGNNDLSFFKPWLQLVVADPHRAGHELRYHAGETSVRLADVVVINKVDTAKAEDISTVKKNVRSVNPTCIFVETESPISVDSPSLIQGKRVLVIEDGPTITHGEMPFGAGYIAAKNLGASEIVDPRPFARGELREVFKKFPHIGPVLPALGYIASQIKDLEETVNSCSCDSVLVATPIDLRRMINVKKPSVRARYDVREKGKPDLREVVHGFVSRIRSGVNK